MQAPNILRTITGPAREIYLEFCQLGIGIDKDGKHDKDDKIDRALSVAFFLAFG